MYELRFPADDLRPFIESYWFVACAPGEVVDLSVDVYVDVRADLIFNFGVAYARTVCGGTRVLQAASNLDAQRTAPIRIHQAGNVEITGVRFRTAGLSFFVDEDLSTFTNRVVPLPEALGPRGASVALAIRGRSPDDQKELLDAHLRAMLIDDDGRRTTLAVARRIDASGGIDRVEALCAHGGVSQRQLDRLFRQHLGVSPKVLSRVARFQRALNRLKTDPGCTLAAVAADCGYYDQPHFVRDFKRFSGVPPRAQVGYFPKDAPTDFSPNLVQFVQDRPPR